MILNFSRFIMRFFFYSCSLSFILSLQRPHTFPLPTLSVSLCSSSCPSIRGVGSCASQIPVQQFPVEDSGDCHMAQVADDCPLLMVCSIWEVPAEAFLCLWSCEEETVSNFAAAVFSLYSYSCSFIPTICVADTSVWRSALFSLFSLFFLILTPLRICTSAFVLKFLYLPYFAYASALLG